MYDSIIIIGPTASGKTKLSIELAKALQTEIINADSMYIYDKLNIGTAKPTIEEMNGINHHLIGFVSPENTFNVSQYRIEAKSILNKFRAKNLIPIIVGGTGFYIDSLIKNFSYGNTEKDETIRNQLNNELNEFGKEYLYNKLLQLDEQTAKKLHQNDVVRVIRALEIAMTGNKKSEIINNEKPLLENPLIIGLNLPRELLYDRINKRVDIMIDNGLIDEVKNLYNNFQLNPEKHQSMKGIGYKELISYLRGEISLDTAIDQIKQHSRNYAKRQITWFKRYDNIIWFNPIEDGNITSNIIKLLKKSI